IGSRNAELEGRCSRGRRISTVPSSRAVPPWTSPWAFSCSVRAQPRAGRPWSLHWSYSTRPPMSWNDTMRGRRGRVPGRPAASRLVLPGRFVSSRLQLWAALPLTTLLHLNAEGQLLVPSAIGVAIELGELRKRGDRRRHV